jgi:DNA-binding NarL/FixJ family response regulator
MRILLADGQPRVRFALRVLLERDQGYQVVGEVCDAVDLLCRAQECCPDLVLLGWELPGLEEPDALVTLRELCPHLVVIALSGRPEARHAAATAAVDAFVSKTEPADRLLATIEECVASSL